MLQCMGFVRSRSSKPETADSVFAVQPHAEQSSGASSVKQKKVFHVRLLQGVEPEWVSSQSG